MTINPECLRLESWEQAASRSALFELANSFISHVHSSGGVPELIRILMKSKSDDLRDVASWVITELGEHQVDVFDCIEAGLKDLNPAVRHHCCVALLESDAALSQRCVSRLLELLADEDIGVLHAVAALLMCPALELRHDPGTPNAPPWEEFDERVLVALNSCQLGDDACREFLTNGARCMQLAALISAYRCEAAAIVVDAFSVSDPLIRSIAVSNAYRFGAELIPALVNAVKSEHDESVRASAWCAFNHLAVQKFVLPAEVKEAVLLRLQTSEGDSGKKAGALSVLLHFIPLSRAEFTIVCRLLADKDESTRFWAGDIAETTAKCDPNFLENEKLADAIVEVALNVSQQESVREAALRVLWRVPQDRLGDIASMYPDAMTTLLADRSDNIVTHALDLIRKCNDPQQSIVVAVKALGERQISATVQRAYSKLLQQWAAKPDENRP